MVAGMYLNRYNAGMPLQADPTVKFAVKQFDLHRVAGAILRVSSPYNTYAHIGLPPGPIRIPTVESLEAVLNRTKHDYFFMVSRRTASNISKTSESYLSRPSPICAPIILSAWLPEICATMVSEFTHQVVQPVLRLL